MKIHSTKEEKKEAADQEAKLTLELINQKLEKSDELKVSFDRDDFNEELSTNMGWGFQDLKPQFRTVVTELVKKNYNLDFFPTFTEKGFGVDIVIKK